MKSAFYLLFLITIASLHSQEVVIRSPIGEFLIIDVAPEESFTQVVELLQHHFGDEEFLIDFMVRSSRSSQTIEKKSQAPQRNYNQAVTSEEKKDVSFVVNTLGMSSLAKITASQSSIKKAGKRIDHLHPLNFLMTIFSDEEMKASVHAMQGRTWVWSGFIKGVKDSFEIETDRGNVKPEHIQDFAKKLGIKIDLVQGPIEKRQWTQLVSNLIDHIPRNVNANRYNM